MDKREDQTGRSPAAQVAVLTDTPSLFARSWYASRRGELAEEHSSRVAALTAGLHSLFHILARGGPLIEPVDRILFCWDGEAKTLKPRAPKPPEYFNDRDYFEETLKILLGGCHAHPNTESDDAVATAAYRLADRGERCVVVSGDKDLHQIVGNNVEYYCLNKKCLLSHQHIIDRWSVKRPIHVGVALAVLGDHDDGISGVSNWGPVKTAKAFESVQEGMGLSEVISTIADQLPKSELDNFYRSLEATLLNGSVESVPDPAPITFVEPEALDELELGHLRPAYARLKSAFSRPLDGPSESPVDEGE